MFKFTKKTSVYSLIKNYQPLILALFAGSAILSGAFMYKPEVVADEIDPAPTFVPSSDMPFIGRAEAPVTVIEFADPLCPGSKTFFETVEPQLRAKYIDLGMVKFYQWPMIIKPVKSTQALQAMYCAADQGKYWEYRNHMLEQPRTGPLGWADFVEQDYSSFAEDMDLDMKAFGSCLASGKYVSLVQAKDRVRADAGINASASVVFNGKIVVWPNFEEVSAAIDRSLVDLENN